MELMHQVMQLEVIQIHRYDQILPVICLFYLLA